MVELTQARLAEFFATLDLNRPERARDLLLEYLPILVDEYGAVAAVTAAEWYEDVRVSSVGGTFAAQLADGVPRAQVLAGARYKAGGLFTDDPGRTLESLAGPVQRYVLYSSRATVASNARADPAKPRFARVPTGARTCAWCSMLASRGFVYATKEAAGTLGNSYHDHCNCQAVVEWDRRHHIDGYDPDAMHAQYLAARRAAGTSDPRAVAEMLRRLYPDSFTDGVHEHE